MDRYWARVQGRIIIMLENSTWALTSLGGEIIHPWDLDCIWEQLAAQEAGLA